VIASQLLAAVSLTAAATRTTFGIVDLLAAAALSSAATPSRLATAQLATKHGLSVIPAMFVGALIAAVVGAIIALPALRLGGIFLSLATLAFAFFFQNVLLNFSWVGGGLLPIEAPRPLLFNIDFSTGTNNGDNKFLLFALVMLTLVSIAVIWVRGGTTGRGCPTTQNGATYVTSDMVLDTVGFRSWERGYDPGGTRRWGEPVPYVFVRRTPLPSP
jgi:ABC-type branched-subunit amino acid transport system permease subunit